MNIVKKFPLIRSPQCFALISKLYQQSKPSIILNLIMRRTLLTDTLHINYHSMRDHMYKGV